MSTYYVPGTAEGARVQVDRTNQIPALSVMNLVSL